MEAAPLSPDRARELAELRRRAYGPESDIHLDAAALARLHDLESLLQRERTASSPTPTVAADRDPQPQPEPEPAPSAAPPADPAPVIDDGRTVSPPPVAARPGMLRRLPRWLIAVACLVVGIVIGAAFAIESTPRPDQTLHIASAVAPPGGSWTNDLSAWGIRPDSLVPFETYKGVDVWSARNDEQSPCLILSKDSMLITASCTREGVDPILDWIVSTYEATFDDSVPENTWIRFMLKGSTVEVWLSMPRSAAQSIATSWRASDASAP